VSSRVIGVTLALAVVALVMGAVCAVGLVVLFALL
jgi:hypothetical protein